VVSPILLPFIIVFFALAFVVYRHQVKIWITSRIVTQTTIIHV
jgi:hypothetical protein